MPAVVLASLALSVKFVYSQPPVIWAMMEQESGRRIDTPPGDGGRSHGILQIGQLYIDDINEYHGTSFTLDDAYSVVDAIRMVWLYDERWGDGTAETMARNHNGGPDGHRQECTAGYWNDIERILQDWRLSNDPNIE